MIRVFRGTKQLDRELIHTGIARHVALQALSRAEADIADATAVGAAQARWRRHLVPNAALYSNIAGAQTYFSEARRANALEVVEATTRALARALQRTENHVA